MTAAGQLYSARARYYSPTTERFVSEDPIGLKGGVNVYRYVLSASSVRVVSHFSGGRFGFHRRSMLIV
jgi:RHS repeat-associated protein